MKAYIVDDEEFGRMAISDTLRKFFPEIAVVGMAADADTAFKEINQLGTDILFLDVELPGKNGFELLNMFDNPSFKVIFVTAFDKYAIHAIKCAALDYILKPVTKEEMAKAIDKVKKMNQPDQQLSMQSLLQILDGRVHNDRKICVPTGIGFSIINVDTILYCEASLEYSYIVYSRDRKELISYTIGEMESILKPFNFYRIHNSFLINKKHISKYIKGDGGIVLLNENIELPVSKRRKIEFLSWLKTAR